ncbi:MAG TPA: enoyl-CoA hydratase/isomerase family protein [Xanthomonadaceae bacterium]|nr:enoyl-CoA hydratase/isomerase family protein [Xanthomonadaceae bacterium]
MIETRPHGKILEVHLARPPVNALNGALLAALRDALVDAPAHGAEAIVVSGGDKVFSAGLDVPELMTLDRDALERTWREFFGVCETLARSPVPVAAAIGGHAPAGGAVLSLFCDYRVMAHGPFRIGLNETQVGLVVPDCIQYAYRRLLGPRNAEHLLMLGAMLEAEEALRIGLVDELVAPEQVLTRAVAWLDALLLVPRKPMLATRAMARADLVEAISDPRRLDLPRFLDEWFTEETQAVLRALVTRLKGG